MSANDVPDVIEEQDRFLPIANISRIMKRVVPVEGKLSKEARECVQECVTEFIQFIVSEASDMCIQEKRKTINSEDLLKALGKLSFDPYLDALKTYIEGYRAAQKNGNSVPIDAARIASTSEVLTPTTSAEQSQEYMSLVQTDVQVYVDQESGQHYVYMKDANNQEHAVPINLDLNNINRP